MVDPIPISGPDITEHEVAYVAEAVKTAWFGNAYAFNDRFERAFADYLGCRFALATPNGTTAIHLALAGLGVGAGDEVILPDLTWIACAAPVIYVGATPKFVDIDPVTWCLDVEAVAAAVTPKTRAIIAVGLYGNMPDMVALREFAAVRGIAMLEDAAEALGSSQGNRKAGTFGDVGAFSFHGSKTVTTGEGGMAVTDDEALFLRMQRLRNHGRVVGDKEFASQEIGFKYIMSSLQAALGLAQIERVDTLVAKKREVFKAYAARLGGLPGLRLNAEPEGFFNSYWMTSLVLDPALGVTALDLREHLRTRGIDARPFFSRLSEHPQFRDQPGAETARARNLHSEQAHRCGINLPSGATLSPPQIERVCDAVAEFLVKAAA